MPLPVLGIALSSLINVKNILGVTVALKLVHRTTHLAIDKQLKSPITQAIRNFERACYQVLVRSRRTTLITALISLILLLPAWLLNRYQMPSVINKIMFHLFTFALLSHAFWQLIHLLRQAKRINLFFYLHYYLGHKCTKNTHQQALRITLHRLFNDYYDAQISTPKAILHSVTHFIGLSPSKTALADHFYLQTVSIFKAFLLQRGVLLIGQISLLSLIGWILRLYIK